MTQQYDITQDPPQQRVVKKRRIKWKKLILVLLVALLIPSVSYGAYYMWQINNTLNVITDDHIKVAEKDLAKNKPLSILLLGKDSRPQVGTMNTDVIMLLTMNPKTHKVVSVSVPRDARLDISDYSLDHKANWFYAAAMNDNQGDKAKVYKEMKHVYGEYLKTDIDYVIMVNFETLKDLVNAVGGVKVYVDQDMKYTAPGDGTYIYLRRGWQVLNGKKALDFVRYRKSNMGTKGSNDFERNNRQQRVIQAILSKVKSPSTILTGGGILKAVAKNVEMDIPRAQLISMIRTYAGSTSKKDINFVTLTGEWVSPFVEINQQDLDDARAKLQANLEKDNN